MERLKSNEFWALRYIADYQDFLLYNYFALREHLLHGFNPCRVVLSDSLLPWRMGP